MGKYLLQKLNQARRLLFGYSRSEANGPAGAAAAWQASRPRVRRPGSFPLGSAALTAHAGPVFAEELSGVAMLLGLLGI